jgi:alkylation response protein AidB-like acyl-CoA dehydrogenase
MELEFTEEQEQLRDSVRAFLARECPVSLVREVVEKGSAPERLWSQMVELGWSALIVDEHEGGLGSGPIELAVLLEELGRSIAPGPFVATVTQFVPAVREAGTAEQRREWLGRVARGSLTATAALADDGGLWDETRLATTARRDGDGWLLDGIKDYVLDGSTADEIAVLARTDDGLRLFVVPRSDAEVRPVPALDPSRPIACVHLTGVHVAGERALGDGGLDPRIAGRIFEESVVALALEAVGACQSIFDVALDYAKTRHQFGVPIGSFQAIKHKFADMLVALEKARATAYFASLTIAEEDERRTLAASMAKAAAGDCQRLLGQEGIQIMGGIGYTWEHDMHLYVKRAKTCDALLGTAAAHREVIANHIGLGTTQ